MLMMTSRYATLREEKARQTIDWLVGNFELKPIKQPVVARMELRREAATPAEAQVAEAAEA